MREIKFRAWDNVNSTMFNVGVLINGVANKDWRDCEDGVRGSKIIMQYTGLKDSEGVEIYEGDVIEFGNGDRFLIDCENHLELFANPIGDPECEDQVRDLYRIENAKVIGNVHNNPDLCKQE